MHPLGGPAAFQLRRILSMSSHSNICFTQQPSPLHQSSCRVASHGAACGAGGSVGCAGGGGGGAAGGGGGGGFGSVVFESG